MKDEADEIFDRLKMTPRELEIKNLMECVENARKIMFEEMIQYEAMLDER
jgi:hypothetical protein